MHCFVFSVRLCRVVFSHFYSLSMALSFYSTSLAHYVCVASFPSRSPSLCLCGCVSLGLSALLCLSMIYVAFQRYSDAIFVDPYPSAALSPSVYTLPLFHIYLHGCLF